MKPLPLVLTCALLSLSLAGCVIVPAGPPPAPPPPPAAASVEVSYFHESLAPYGQWVWVEPYGEVWTPAGVPVGWRPYTVGRWVYTDSFGWTWVSYDEWGWAPFHYGRWFFDVSYGWCWIPGTVWAPAWVAWRCGDGYVGWAPLPPGARLEAAALHTARIEPYWWCFIPERAILEVRVERFVVPAARSVTLVNVTRVTNRGLEVSRIETVIGRPVPRFVVTERRSLAESRGVLPDNRVALYRPSIPAGRPARLEGARAPNRGRPASATRVSPVPPVEGPPPPATRASPVPPVRGPRVRAPAVQAPAVQAPAVEAPPAQAPAEELARRQVEERRLLEERNAAERRRLGDLQRRELEEPPQGVSAQDLQARQEAERRALEAEALRERQVLDHRHERQSRGEGRGRPPESRRPDRR